MSRIDGLGVVRGRRDGRRRRRGSGARPRPANPRSAQDPAARLGPARRAAPPRRCARRPDAGAAARPRPRLPSTASTCESHGRSGGILRGREREHQRADRLARDVGARVHEQPRHRLARPALALGELVHDAGHRALRVDLDERGRRVERDERVRGVRAAPAAASTTTGRAGGRACGSRGCAGRRGANGSGAGPRRRSRASMPPRSGARTIRRARRHSARSTPPSGRASAGAGAAAAQATPRLRSRCASGAVARPRSRASGGAARTRGSAAPSAR